MHSRRRRVVGRLGQDCGESHVGPLQPSQSYSGKIIPLGLSYVFQGAPGSPDPFLRYGLGAQGRPVAWSHLSHTAGVGRPARRTKPQRATGPACSWPRHWRWVPLLCQVESKPEPLVEQCGGILVKVNVLLETSPSCSKGSPAIGQSSRMVFHIPLWGNSG